MFINLLNQWQDNILFKGTIISDSEIYWCVQIIQESRDNKLLSTTIITGRAKFQLKLGNKEIYFSTQVHGLPEIYSWTPV